jgi:hypothetical protein
MGADSLLNYNDPVLTNVSIGYKQDDLFSEMIAPPVPVEKPTGNIWVMGKEKFSIYETMRSAKSEAREIPAWARAQLKFNCQGHSLKDSLDDFQAASADPGLDWDITTTENLTQAIVIRQEYDYMNAIINGTGPLAPSTAITSGTPANLWSDFNNANSNPISDVETQRATIKKATGAKPNTLAVGYPVWQALIQHPKIIDRFKYTVLPNGFPTEGQLASVFQVDNFWVLGAIYNTAAEGQAPSTDFIWGKNALLAVIPPSPRKREVALCYTPFWTFSRSDGGAAMAGGSAIGGLAGNRGYLVRRYRIEAKRTDVIEIDKWYDLTFAVTAAGYVFTGAVS